MSKKPLFTTKTLVGTGLGAALFMVLFMFVKIPSPVPSTNFQIAYGVAAFFAAIFGPLAGGLIGLIGHALTDFILSGSPWWSWVFASLVACAIFGICYYVMDIEEGKFTKKDMIKFCVITLIGNAIAWIGVAPILDIVMYAEPSNLVFTQGITSFIMNGLTTCVVGCVLCALYAKTRVASGSLDRE